MPLTAAMIKNFHPNSSLEPSRIEWMCFVFMLIVQQNAFVSIPMLIEGLTIGEMRGVQNVFNTFAVALSLVLIGWTSLRYLRSLTRLFSMNLLTTAFMGLVLLSTIWSIHPSITFRRGVGYILTTAIAALLPLRFGVDGSMRVLSASFVMSSLGSFAFVILFPQHGIMHLAGLEGCWQGVFDTKQLLGAVMTVAIFVELYILIRNGGRQRWRFLTLLAYSTLLVLSRSMTQLLVALAYSAGAGAYLLWRRNGWRGVSAVTAIMFAAYIGFALIMPGPQSVFAAIGKDSTLTGRADFWPAVLHLIGEKPILGWGYRAMWQPDDPTTARVDSIAGFAVPGSHNAFLEVALGLGGVGLLVMALIICVAIRRSILCCAHGCGLLGWFSLMFFVGTVVAGATTETLGQNQLIEWLVFCALFFICGAINVGVNSRMLIKT